MKTLITTLLSILFYFQVSAQNQLGKFRITIQSYHHGGDGLTIITQDSIKSTHVSVADFRIDLKQKLNDYPKMILEKAIPIVEIEKLADDYYAKGAGPLPDGEIEFDFTFEIKGKTKKTHIYGGRNEQILKFVNQINEIVPSCFQIPYTEEYLKRFGK